ncbi:hypothetical protein CIP107532_00161 [Corynebacterium diphtheriae]|nr:hypothetical protein CIP107532_00161 [Corynebacterium diphtheriae]
MPCNTRADDHRRAVAVQVNLRAQTEVWMRRNISGDILIRACVVREHSLDHTKVTVAAVFPAWPFLDFHPERP